MQGVAEFFGSVHLRTQEVKAHGRHGLMSCMMAAQEIDRESSRGHVSQEQLRAMPYTEACVKEALRLYPPATVLARQLTANMDIMGHRVPKGTGIFVSPRSCSLRVAVTCFRPAVAASHQEL